MPTDSPQLPPVDASAISLADSVAGQEEQKAFFAEGKLLDLHLRRWAGYGALGVSVVLYLVAVVFTARVSKLVPADMQLPSWHVLVVALIALFTVPTVLVLAVLRSASIVTKDAEADSLHAVIGTKVMSLIDRLLDKLVDFGIKK